MEQQLTGSRPVRSTAHLLLDLARDVLRRFNIVSLKPQIEACENLFGQDRIIDVAVLGQFKAGKSSFINSLIGQDVLPVGVIPVTTVITRLYYGKERRAVVTHFDGSIVQVPVNEVEQYISEEKNPANEKNVEVVDIALPALGRYQGLRLVDTPGLGSVFKYNTETSQRWLPEVGAAVVAVSAARPLSENDINLIRELARHTPNIMLLLTKTDLLSHEQQRDVIGFFKKTLRREMGRELPIHPYSILLRTDLLKTHIDNLLLSLSKNRDTEFENIIRHKIVSLTKACRGYLEFALKTSLKADDEREALKKLILTERLNYHLIRSELFTITRNDALQTRTVIATRFEAKKAEFTRRLIARLREEMVTWKGGLWRLTRRYEEWLEENLTRELADLSRKEHPHFFGTLNRAYMSTHRSVDLFRNLLDRNIETVLGVKLSVPQWEMVVPEPSHPDVAFARVFDFHLDALWFLIPMFILRGVFEKHFLKKVPGIAEMHMSRLAYQWEVRINRTIEEIRDQALEYVQDELSTIDILLSQSAGRSEEIRNTIGELQDYLAKLET
jgi:GTP-binding protein EngB required for normal cell division